MYIYWDGKRKLPRQQAHVLPPEVEIIRDVVKDPEERPTGWYELVDELPEDYIERFPGLLGASIIGFDDTDNKLHRKYMNPDFSPPRIRDELVKQMKMSARHYLNQTDWLVVRQMEQGVPVPAEIKADRSRVRDLVRWYEGQIALLPVDELPDYSWTFQPPHWTAPHSHPIDLPPGVVMVSETGQRDRITVAGGPEIPETPIQAPQDEGPVVAPGPDRRG